MAARRDKPTEPGSSGDVDQTILHASCVALAGRGLLILGASGSGKSSLALAMMAYGGDLVADDRVVLTGSGRGLMASAPAPIEAMIEARGIGLLNARPHGPVAVFCVVDLDRTEPDRLPPVRQKTILGRSVTLLYKVQAPHFTPALVQFLKAGRCSG